MLNRGNQSIAVLVLTLVVSSCSMKDRDVNYGVSVSFPIVARSGFAGNSVIMAGTPSPTPANGGNATNNGNGFATPTSLADFQCFALNITGPGLASDPRFGCSDPTKANMGLIAGMAPVSGGRVDAMVPAGASRTIQLIGLQSTVGCPSFEGLLSTIDPATGKGGIQGIGDAYLLGQTSVDVFGDVTVNVQAQFDVNSKLFKGCDNGGSNSSQELTFQTTNGKAAVLSNSCQPIQMEVHLNNGQNAMPGTVTVDPVVSGIVGGGTVALYPNGSCAAGSEYVSGISSPFTFLAGESTFQTIFAMTSGTATGFSLQMNTTATGWATPKINYQVVNQQIYIPNPYPTPVMGSCVQLSMYEQDVNQNTLPLALTSPYEIQLYNLSNNGATLPAAQMYFNDGSCSGTPISPAPQTDSHRQRYLVSFAATSDAIYIKSTAVQNVYVTASRSDAAGVALTRPAGQTVQFDAFALHTPMTFKLAKDGGPNPISINGDSGFQNVTNVRLGSSGTGSTITYQNPSMIMFQPSARSPGIYPVFFGIADGAGGIAYYNTGFQAEYLNFATGDGSSSFPYEVDSLPALSDIEKVPNSNFVQNVDINASGAAASGNLSYIVQTGQFGGTYSAISGARIMNTTLGLFQVCQNAHIDGITFFQPQISASSMYVGTLCGYADTTSVTGVTVQGSLGTSWVQNSQSNGITGGIIGSMQSSSMIDISRVTGVRISGAMAYAYAITGGIVGELVGTSQLTHVAAMGNNVQADGFVGGLAGSIGGSAMIRESFVDGGNVTAGMIPTFGSAGGGLMGLLAGGTINDSFANQVVVSGQTQMGGFIGQLTAGTINRTYATSLVTSADAVFSDYEGIDSSAGAAGVGYSFYFNHGPNTPSHGLPITQMDNYSNYTNFDFGSGKPVWSKRATSGFTNDFNKTPVLSWACLPTTFFPAIYPGQCLP